MVGQALYRLVFFDFLFLMLGSFFGEFLRKWVFFFFKLTKCILFCFFCSDLTTSSFLFYSLIGRKLLPNLGVPEFDVARNVFELIYAQTLVWYGLRLFPTRHHQEPTPSRPDFLIVCLLRIGIYFSPLLPVIQILKCFIFFYVKKVNPRPYPFQPA